MVVEALGGTVTNHIRVVNSIAAAVPAAVIGELAASRDVLTVSLDSRSIALLDTSTCAVGAPTLWSQNVNGAGFQAAVLDSGVNKSHPGLAPLQLQTYVSLSTASTKPGFIDVLTDVDLHGHGTHVTGIVASNFPLFLGVAHGAVQSIHVKAGGLSLLPFLNVWVFDADAAAGVEWALFQAANPAEVFNASYGGKTNADDSWAAMHFDQVINTFDVSAVFAAGNDGQSGPLSSPCIAFNGFCVANFSDGNTCTTGNDFISSSSSAGPTVGGRLKPDISAPGTHSCGCRISGQPTFTNQPFRHGRQGRVNCNYVPHPSWPLKFGTVRSDARG